ncbi:MAG: hypothetical protein ONB44_15950 [candidate division KSB1 bacterium]|nr:hypothetical protein [candidate division KSB1 bacterium]MDZ7303626.1 hypothetical protein [candidate division KSB1 bacterium]MDZ7312863.1 hypothetical protein [candidate division KSB1 bacterium]
MNVKVITQDVATLRQAFQQRKREYDALRAAEEWAGAVMHAGMLLELALKIAVCKNMNVTHLPRVFQVHDLDFLLYCSGSLNILQANPDLLRNFGIIATRWSMELRYEGPVITQAKSDEIHNALFDSVSGVLTLLNP